MQKRRAAQQSKPTLITARLLRRWALPQPSADGDKEERGRVLVIGGAPQMPGAVLLAATAALRAGAGKLQIAACESIAPHVGIAAPESLVIAARETKAGGIAPASAQKIAERARAADAVLIGPGMVDEAAIVKLIENLLPALREKACLILDAAALEFVKRNRLPLRALEGRIILTPHAGEMAHITGETKESIARAPLETARRAAEEFRAVVALKGAKTFIAAPDGASYCNRYGNIGLATSGSGDTLSGIIAGLAARGAAPAQATVWGVYLHARAGDALSERIGQMGFLAREVLDEIPTIMNQLGKKRRR
jgi:ADP-dependent NAD(P)H-hydrate dehydratase